MNAFLANPKYLVAAAVGLGLVLIVLLLLRRRQKGPDGPGEIPGVEEALRKGNYLQAGFLAAKHERYEEAIDYYLRAQEPARAAQIAARTRNVRRAAELYERAGDFERAAHFYEQVGMPDKADEMRRALALRQGEQRAGEALGPSPAPAPGPAAAERPAPSSASAAPGTTDPAVARFREAEAAAKGDVAAKARLQSLGAEAAEALLRSGDIRGAAEIYRRAGLHDEAIHLYVNVLGAPGEAAPLVAAQGKHERAAELYELAGQAERAAAAWADVARASNAPEQYVDRIERLSEQVALRLLEEVAARRPPSEKSADLHYRLARALERQGQGTRAAEVYVALQGAVGSFRDVDQRIAALRSAPADGGAALGTAATMASLPPPTAGGERGARTRQTAGAYGPGVRDDSAAAPARPVRPTDIGLSAEQLSAIAREVVEAAVAQAKRGAVFAEIAAGPVTVTRRTAREEAVRLVVGLEQAHVSLEALNDAAALAARDGPSISTLQDYIGGRACDLQNIEVYYRLGLAHLAGGQWAEALAAFDAVEEASPGYRDAGKRAEQLRAWQKAVGPRLSLAVPGRPVSTERPARYQIRGELGRGGMAVVYRAWDEVLGRDVALKFVSEELTKSPEVQELFQREARSVAALNHPNIITVYDFGVLEGKTFLCMEYLDGTSVEHLLEERGRLTVVEALRIVRQVLDALDYAHARQIVHRDIKPSNMMRTKTGLVKLMDFGLAKSVSAGAKASQVAGTPPYMPLEQLQGREVDHRADLFAVGCSLYEMLTATLPFEGFDRSTAPRSVQLADPTLPAVLDRILQRALQADPAARYQSAAEFAAPIRRILEAVDSIAAQQTMIAGHAAPALT